jgi:hypothetical protein
MVLEKECPDRFAIEACRVLLDEQLYGIELSSYMVFRLTCHAVFCGEKRNDNSFSRHKIGFLATKLGVSRHKLAVTESIWRESKLAAASSCCRVA